MLRQGLLRLAHPVVRNGQPQFRRYLSSISFTSSHEYIKVDGDTATIGISTHAANALGEIAFVDLPEVGDEVVKGNTFAAVDSVKAASDVYAPASGIITEVNEELGDNPGLINESPEEDGWFLKIKISDKAEISDLMSEDEYAKHIAK